MIARLYRKYMPMRLRYALGKWRMRRSDQKNLRRIGAGEWMENYPEESRYILEKDKILAIPYRWTEEYDEKDIDVHRDPECGMPYVLVGDRRMYFPARYPASYIRAYFNSLRIEQDPRSPHFYFDPADENLKDCTFADIGAAEGFITLRIMDVVEQAILVEADPDWIRALKKTFDPWKDKVVIHQCYAGAQPGDGMMTVDEICSDRSKIVLKMDVEGMEEEVLRGAEQVLSCDDTAAYVCTYHKPGDFEKLGAFLEQRGYQQEASSGVMFYGTYDGSFRKGLLRARKRPCK